jgi:hypothetical protein
MLEVVDGDGRPAPGQELMDGDQEVLGIADLHRLQADREGRRGAPIDRDLA